MKDLAIRDGDLVIGDNGHATVTGSDRVRQNLGMALREAYGIDRFHPRYGSTLHTLIGRPQSDPITMLTRAEAQRVVDGWILVQSQQFRNLVNKSSRARYTAGEVVTDVEGIDVVPDMDRIHLRVRLRTLSNEQIALVQTVRGE